MEKMNSNELENELMEVTGGAAETDLVPIKEKSSELVPKPDYKTVECWFCKKKFKFPILPVSPDKESCFPTTGLSAGSSRLIEEIEKCKHYLCPECAEKFHPHPHSRRFH